MKILVAEDNPVFRRMLESMLPRWGYEVVAVADGNEAWRLLQAGDSPRLALLDWMMPGMDGVDICRMLRQAAREPYIYVLLLTARTLPKDLVEGMEAGADDYITKPLQAHELRVRLRAGSRIVELQDELVRAREALREQATHDALTGIWNRRAVLEALHRELLRTRRDRQPLSIIMADLDSFKKINDRHGHEAGDAVLVEFARRIHALIRGYDAVGRYGGEEFLIVLPGCDALAASVRAEQMRAAISGTPVALSAQTSIAAACSMGVACMPAEAALPLKRLIRDADTALYEAKRNGRNRVEVADRAETPA